MLQDACRLGRLAVGHLDPEAAQTPTDQLLFGAGRALGQGLGVDDGNASSARARGLLHHASKVGQGPVADEHVVGVVASDADTPGAVMGLRYPRRLDAVALGRATGLLGRGGRGRPAVRHGSENTDRLRRLDAECDEDQGGDLLRAEPVGGDGEGGHLGVQRCALRVERLHARQDAVVPTTALVTVLAALLSRTGLVGVGVWRHEGTADAITYVLGGRARGGGQVDNGVSAQQLTVLRAHHRSPAQGDDTVRSRRRVQDGSHGTVLAVAEALLPLGGEDLWDRHPGAPADLGIGIGDLYTQRLGQKPGLGGLARAGQPHQDQGQLVVAQGDGWNALPGHDRVSLTVEQAIGTSIAFTDGITTRFTSVSAGLCEPGRPEGCAWPR